MIACTLIGQSAVVYFASKLMDISHVFWINHFTVVCSVTWPLDGIEAGVDLVLIEISLILLCKTSFSDAN